METTRTFVAIELGDWATNAIERSIRSLKNKVESVRWSRTEQLHLTLKFLGEIDNRDLPEICQRLRVACAEASPFGIRFRGLGTFPKNKPPRVIWAGVEEGTEELFALQERVEGQLLEFGTPQQTKSFTPHLTLGRVQRTADTILLQKVIAAESPLLDCRCEVDSVVLLASLKEQGRLLYEPVDTIELS